MRYITFSLQKDKRVTLGTAVHKTPSCYRLAKTNNKIIKITGEILNLIPKCKHCFKLTKGAKL